MGAVGGADLDQARARLGEHVGDAEAAADLDQLAAADRAPRRCRRARRARAARAAALLLTASAASAPVSSASSAPARRAREPRRPRREVELERAVAAADLGDPLERRLGERSPAEVGVDDHSGRIDHAAGAARRLEGRGRGEHEVARIGRSAVSAGVLRCGPQRVAGGDPPVGGDQPGRVVAAEQRIDRRHGAHGTPLRKRSGAGVEPTNRWVAPACRF